MNTHQRSRVRLTAAITIAIGGLLVGCTSPGITPGVGDPVKVIRDGGQHAPSSQPANPPTAPSAAGGRLSFR